MVVVVAKDSSSIRHAVLPPSVFLVKDGNFFLFPVAFISPPPPPPSFPLSLLLSAGLSVLEVVSLPHYHHLLLHQWTLHLL